MGYFPFANNHFQMGVTVMGFTEQFWHDLIRKQHNRYYTIFWSAPWRYTIEQKQGQQQRTHCSGQFWIMSVLPYSMHLK